MLANLGYLPDALLPTDAPAESSAGVGSAAAPLSRRTNPLRDFGQHATKHARALQITLCSRHEGGLTIFHTACH